MNTAFYVHKHLDHNRFNVHRFPLHSGLGLVVQNNMCIPLNANSKLVTPFDTMPLMRNLKSYGLVELKPKNT